MHIVGWMASLYPPIKSVITPAESTKLLKAVISQSVSAVSLSLYLYPILFVG